MSTTLVGAVLNHGPENGPLSHAMVALADNADDYGLAWPSLETIALKSRCDVRTAMRRLKALEKAGWITVHRRAKGKYSVYVIDIEKLGVTLNAKSRRSGFWDDLEKKIKARRAKEGMLKLAPAKKSHDKMSPQIGLPLDVSGDTSGKFEVTTTAISHDTSGNSLKVLNRKEPSLNQRTYPTLPGREGEIDPVDRGRWNSLLVELKQGLCSTPANVERAKRWKAIKPGENDYDACFRAWWLLEVERTASGLRLITHAGDEPTTEAGIAKYEKRLQSLVRKHFELGADAEVAFEVRVGDKTSNGHTADEGQSNGNGAPHGDTESHGPNGETLVDMLLGAMPDPWHQVKCELAAQLQKLGKRDLGDKLDWYRQSIEPTRLLRIEDEGGKPVWKVLSDAPKKTRAVMSLLGRHFNLAVNKVVGGEVQIVVLNPEGGE